MLPHRGIAHPSPKARLTDLPLEFPQEPEGKQKSQEEYTPVSCNKPHLPAEVQLNS